MPFKGRVDLCVAAVVENEFKAARKVLEHVTKSEFEGPYDCFKSDDPKRLMVVLHYIEWNEFKEGKRPLRIALVTPIEMGREAAAQLVSNVSHTTLNPSMIVMVGMAAGYDKKVQLGDVLVPFKITRDAGKEFEGGKRAADAQIVDLKEPMKTIVQPVRVSGDCPWVSLIPEDMKDTPSPVYLQDFILSKIPSEEVTLTKIFEEIDKGHPEWTKGAKDAKCVPDDAVVEAVQKLKEEGYIHVKGQYDDVLSRTDAGQKYVDKNSERSPRGSTVFPKDPRLPKIHTDNVLSGDIVNEAVDYKKIAEDVGQRKLIGYEMEGYAFLHSVRGNLNDINALFAKGISDLGTGRSKMKFFQGYCTASATAVVCHLIKGRDFLFPDLGSSGELAIATAEASHPVAPTNTAASHPAAPQAESKSDPSSGFPSDDKEPDKTLIKAVSHLVDDQWQELGQNFSVNTRQIRRQSDTDRVRTQFVIEAWIRGAEKSPTVGTLIAACAQLGDPVSRRAITKKYEELVKLA